MILRDALPIQERKNTTKRRLADTIESTDDHVYARSMEEKKRATG
jgi:hypothetical protein